MDHAREKGPGFLGLQCFQILAKVAPCHLPEHEFVRGRLAFEQSPGEFQKLQRPVVVEDRASQSIEAHDALLNMFQGDGQRLLGLPAGRDVLDRAFIEQGTTLGVMDQAGVLAHPDALAGLVAKDFRYEVADVTLGLQQGPERIAPAGLHVPPGGNIVHRCQHLGFGVKAIHAHQCRIGPQLPALQAAAVGADRQPVEERREIVVRHGGRFVVQGRQCRVAHAAGAPPNRGCTFQMPLAYSRMVRSDENAPMAAMLRMAWRAHSDGRRYRSSTRCCAAT